MHVYDYIPSLALKKKLYDCGTLTTSGFISLPDRFGTRILGISGLGRDNNGVPMNDYHLLYAEK